MLGVTHRLPGLIHLSDAQVLQRDDATGLLVLRDTQENRLFQERSHAPNTKPSEGSPRPDKQTNTQTLQHNARKS